MNKGDNKSRGENKKKKKNTLNYHPFSATARPITGQPLAEIAFLSSPLNLPLIGNILFLLHGRQQ